MTQKNNEDWITCTEIKASIVCSSGKAALKDELNLPENQH